MSNEENQQRPSSSSSRVSSHHNSQEESQWLVQLKNQLKSRQHSEVLNFEYSIESFAKYHSYLDHQTDLEPLYTKISNDLDLLIIRILIFANHMSDLFINLNSSSNIVKSMDLNTKEYNDIDSNVDINSLLSQSRVSPLKYRIGYLIGNRPMNHFNQDDILDSYIKLRTIKSMGVPLNNNNNNNLESDDKLQPILTDLVKLTETLESYIQDNANKLFKLRASNTDINTQFMGNDDETSIVINSIVTKISFVISNFTQLLSINFRIINSINNFIKEIESLKVKIADLNENLGEKENNIISLADELKVHQLEIVTFEEKLRDSEQNREKLNEEFTSMLARWKELKTKEASQINKANEVITEALQTKRNQQALSNVIAIDDNQIITSNDNNNSNNNNNVNTQSKFNTSQKLANIQYELDKQKERQMRYQKDNIGQLRQTKLRSHSQSQLVTTGVDNPITMDGSMFYTNHGNYGSTNNNVNKPLDYNNSVNFNELPKKYLYRKQNGVIGYHSIILGNFNYVFGVNGILNVIQLDESKVIKGFELKDSFNSISINNLASKSRHNLVSLISDRSNSIKLLSLNKIHERNYHMELITTINLDHVAPIAFSQINEDGNLLVTGSYDGNIKFTYLDGTKPNLSIFSAPVIDIELSSWKKILVTAHEDNKIRVWNIDLRLLNEFSIDGIIDYNSEYNNPITIFIQSISVDESYNLLAITVAYLGLPSKDRNEQVYPFTSYILLFDISDKFNQKLIGIFTDPDYIGLSTQALQKNSSPLITSGNNINYFKLSTKILFFPRNNSNKLIVGSGTGSVFVWSLDSLSSITVSKAFTIFRNHDTPIIGIGIADRVGKLYTVDTKSYSTWST